MLGEEYFGFVQYPGGGGIGLAQGRGRVVVEEAQRFLCQRIIGVESERAACEGDGLLRSSATRSGMRLRHTSLHASAAKAAGMAAVKVKVRSRGRSIAFPEE